MSYYQMSYPKNCHIFKIMIFIPLNDIQENLQFIKAIEITNVTHVKSNFLTQGSCRHITPNWVKEFPHESQLWFFTTYVLFQFPCAR